MSSVSENSNQTVNEFPKQSPQRPLAKKLRVARAHAASEPRQCGFLRLPVELLAEVLLSTSSPRDVLAVARCSKYHCNTLMSPSNQFIWKHTRQYCKPAPLPDPPKKFTEASYAAFLFDAGVCEACGTVVKEMMDSFGLRLRLCKKPDCRNKYSSPTNNVLLYHPRVLESHQTFIETLPTLEYSQALSWTIGTIPKYYPESPPVYRSSQWVKALQDYLEASQVPDTFQKFVEECSKKAEWNLDFLKFCVDLHKWKILYQEAYEKIKISNIQFATQLALKEGYTVHDLLNTPTYIALLKPRHRSLEQVTSKDYEKHKATINAELAKVKEARRRREYENTYRQSRELIEKHYNRLRAGKQELPLPSLETFREIPIMRQLQTFPPAGSSEADFDKELKSNHVASKLKTQLNEWREKAKNELGRTLGYEDWKSPSNTKLHPADRVTARWVCKRCHRVSMRYKEDECLDFPGVCIHQCSAPMGKKIDQIPFKAGRFIKDEKAVTAMTKVLEARGISDDDPLSLNALEDLGFRILCKSCDRGNIVMNANSVVGHSHRHDNMEVVLLEEEEAKATLTHPIDKGLALKLLGPENAKASQLLRARKGYGCRHCVQVVPNEPSKKPKTPVMFIFDGLKSHLREKHKVETVRDEDFFYSEELQKAKEESEAKKTKARTLEV
ncbi:hypothetical protein K435DRAFT_749946 [Dendrothele bispora CBS 962.96]|uniref:F-box domain-containing protein n=1 Tax=Dendrothele bispora (strain CBS 962.96) TaxID=1314807 RepID=A0A4S8MH24_DENBC|nr:hypothetical protein K435DRAFT_749946 [Dendrothele bispora CBS 962.96]